MTDTLRHYDDIIKLDLTLRDNARRVVAGRARDVDDARVLLGALGLLSTDGDDLWTSE